MLKSMHAEEDAKYTESRSLSTRFVRYFVTSFLPVRSFVRSLVLRKVIFSPLLH